MTNQRDSLSSSSFGVRARMVCVDSRSGNGSSSFFTSRGMGTGAVATTTCCSDVNLLGLAGAVRGFVAAALRGVISDCGSTGALGGAAGAVYAGAGAVTIGAAAVGGATMTG